MSQPPSTVEERFASIVEALDGEPNVTPPQPGSGFGAAGLKINGKIFAMLVRGRLVVKLPKARVDALIASGAGEPYDPRNDGRLMKEWVSVEPASEADWLPLAREAMQFVTAKH